MTSPAEDNRNVLVQKARLRKHTAMGEEVKFSEHLGRTPQVGPEAEVQIESEHNKLRLPSVVSLSSRSPGPSMLLCAHCVFFNYMEWDFVQFHTRANMQQLFLISDNDSLNFK